MPKIFCFINGYLSGRVSSTYIVEALAEDGTLLVRHYSSTKEFAKMDIGIATNNGFSTAYYHRYDYHYPNGYEVVWLDDPLNDNEFNAAAEKYYAKEGI